MTLSKKLSIVLVTGIVGLMGLKAGEQLSRPGLISFVSTAEARVGRPLTPGKCRWCGAALSAPLCGWRNLLGLARVRPLLG